MAIPEFNDHGDLPSRVYRVNLDEAIQRLGRSTPRRELIAMRLERIYAMARYTRHLKRFVVFGSFVTTKPEPNDVDIFMIMDDDFDVTKVNSPDSILFDHPSAQSHFGASVFWLRACAALGGEQAAMEDWMLTRDGRMRGILELKE